MVRDTDRAEYVLAPTRSRARSSACCARASASTSTSTTTAAPPACASAPSPTWASPPPRSAEPASTASRLGAVRLDARASEATESAVSGPGYGHGRVSSTRSSAVSPRCCDPASPGQESRRVARATPRRPTRRCSRGSRRSPQLCEPDAIHWFDGSDAEFELLCQAAGRGRHVHRARPGQAARLVLGPLRPERRRPGRGPHLHLLRARGRRRPHQQLEGPRRDAHQARRAVPRARCAAARCTWCRSAWARSARRSRTSASRSPTRRTSR